MVYIDIARLVSVLIKSNWRGKFLSYCSYNTYCYACFPSSGAIMDTAPEWGQLVEPLWVKTALGWQPLLFLFVIQNGNIACWFQYMFGALADCVTPIKRSQHMESPADVLQAFDKEINQQFKEVRGSNIVCFKYILHNWKMQKLCMLNGGWLSNILLYDKSNQKHVTIEMSIMKDRSKMPEALSICFDSMAV